MSISEWRQTYWRLRVFARPTLDDCDSVESELEFRLPKSYREFITTIGPGELAEEFRIFGPNHNSKHFDLFNQNRSIKRGIKKMLDLPGMTEADQALRLVYFASNIAGDCFGFDPQSVTKPKHNECKIFLVPRLLEPNEFCADSFHSFIHDFCLGDRYYEYNKVDPADRGDRMVFEHRFGP